MRPRERAAVAIRERHAPDVAGERAVSGLVGMHLAGEREREQRAAVEAVFDAHHAGTSGGVARDLDRVLDRLGAAVHEERLLGERSRRQRREPLRQRDVTLVRRHREGGVGEAIRLPVQRVEHVRVGVADVHHPDATGKIEVHVAVDVGDADAVGGGGKHRRRMRDAARHRRLPSDHQRARSGTGNRRPNLDCGHGGLADFLLNKCMVVNNSRRGDQERAALAAPRCFQPRWGHSRRRGATGGQEIRRSEDQEATFHSYLGVDHPC